MTILSDESAEGAARGPSSPATDESPSEPRLEQWAAAHRGLRIGWLPSRAAAVAMAVGAFALYLSDRVATTILEGELSPSGLTLEVHLVGAYALGVFAIGLCGFAIDCSARLVRRPRLVTAAAYAAIAAAVFGWLGDSLATGDWMARQSYASQLKWAAAAFGALAGGVLGVLVVARERRWWFRLLVSVAALALLSADRVVLPGLYADVHLVAQGIGAALLLIALRSLFRSLRIALRWRLAAAIILLTEGASALMWMSVPAAVKVDALAASPYVANLAPRVLPKPSSDRLLVELGRVGSQEPRRSAAGKHPSWTGDYNVVLIVVDALRADALPPNRDGDEAFVEDGDTPFLDDWLAAGYRFERAYAQATRTKHSMPPMLHGTLPFEHSNKAGLPLAAAMARTGRVPVAIVPQYFLMPFEKASRRLLDDFTHLGFYEKDRQDQMLPVARTLFEELKSQRFFAWVHFYNMHAPYYAGRLTSSRDGSTAERYQMALRWLDQEMRGLIELFDELSLADKTVFVFTCDHGEQISKKFTGHGGTVYEPEIRAPLTIRVPEKPGGVIRDTVVGNIDIVPTVLDLVGAKPLPEYRGRTLVPMMADPFSGADIPYYIVNGSGSWHGLVRGDQKLVYREKSGVFARYDLEKGERKNLFDADSPVDAALVSMMLRMNPEPAAEELDEEKARDLLVERLDDTEGEAVTPDLEFLLRTANLTEDESVRSATDRLFERASTDVRLAMVWHLSPNHRKHWSQRLGQFMRKIDDEAELDEAVATLARRKQAPFAQAWVRQKVAELASREGSTWAPWLSMVDRWKKQKRRASWAEVFDKLFEAVPEQRPPDATIALLLTNARDLAGQAELARHVRNYLGHPDPVVSAAACNAYAALGAPDASLALRSVLTNDELDVRVRQAVLQGLSRVDGDKAVDVIVELAEDPLLTVDAIKALRRTRSSKALPFLRGIVKNHYNWYTRGEAKKAIKAIRRASR